MLQTGSLLKFILSNFNFSVFAKQSFIFLFEIANMIKSLKKIKDTVLSMSLQDKNVIRRKCIFFPELIRYFKTSHLLPLI